MVQIGGTTNINQTNVIFGSKNKSSSFIGGGFTWGSFIYGSENINYANKCSIFGDRNSAYGNDHGLGLAVGQTNTISGNQCVAIGSKNIANGDLAFALGNWLSANSFQTVLGKYNLPLAGVSRYLDERPASLQNPYIGTLFVIGNGYCSATDESIINYSNAMTVSANGTISANDFIGASGNSFNEISNTVNENYLSWNEVSGKQPKILVDSSSLSINTKTVVEIPANTSRRLRNY